MPSYPAAPLVCLTKKRNKMLGAGPDQRKGVARALARIAEFSEHWRRYGYGVYGAFDRKRRRWWVIAA